MKRKRRNIAISVNLQIYRRHVVVFFEVPVETMIRYGIKHGIPASAFSDEWKSGHRRAMEGNGGWCDYFGEGNHDILIWVKKYPTCSGEYGVLYHELYHAVEFVANAVDPKCRLVDEDGTSEARANLFEFLANELNRTLWKRDLRTRATIGRRQKNLRRKKHMAKNGSGKGQAKLNKDAGNHSVPGFMSGGGKPKEWPARTGYTSESKKGPSSHGTKISLPKG